MDSDYQTEVSGNTITIDNSGEYKTSIAFVGDINIKDNDITVIGDMDNIFSGSGIVEDNAVYVSGNLGEFARNCVDVSGNTVNVDQEISVVFRYHGYEFAESAVLSDNTVTSGVASSSQSFAIAATNITLNGNRIELYDNIISMPPKSGSTKDFIYNINTLDAGTPVKTYKEHDEEVDVGDLENVVYINAGNVFRESLVNTYLRGGVEVIFHNAGPNPASGGTGNVLYISPDNRFSESLTGSYRRGNVKVIE